jgi:GTP-binding protein HflX
MPAYAADQLFATLDTTSRKLWIEGAGNIVISDTVGFIRDLPHSLVDAFHATLEAATDADVLLHVVDSASHARDEQIAEVNKVLAEIDAEQVRQVVVWNKIDLTEASPGVERDEYGNIARVRVSARSGEGLDLLRESLAEYARAKAEARQKALVDAAREAQNDYIN